MADVFVSSSTYVLGGIGIPANCFLICLIVQCTPPYLKGYSKLMFASCICDIIGLLAVVGTDAREVVFDWSCYFEYSGVCAEFGVETCASLFGIQCEMYSTSVMMMCFSFFYRYCLLEQASECTLRNMRRIVLPAIVVVNIPLARMFYTEILIGASRSYLIETYKKSHATTSTIIGLTYFRDSGSLFLLIFTVSSAFIPFVASILLRHLTVRKTQNLDFSMSQSTKEMHRILVKVLNTQLVLVALFFVGCSFFLVDLLEMPFMSNTSIVAVPLCNLQNVCPPIANLYIIIPYRRKIAGLCRADSSKLSVIALQSSAFTNTIQA